MLLGCLARDMLVFGMTGNDFSGIGVGIWWTLKIISAACVIFVQLGLWKLAELAIWLWQSVEITVK